MNLNLDSIQSDFNLFTQEYKDTEEYNEFLYNHFENSVDKYDFLRTHCNIVAEHSLGYGEKAFRYLWLLLYSQMASPCKFLEIGVYKGSILALSQLISSELNIDTTIFGVTPLNATGDKYSAYHDSNYEYDISYLYHLLDIPIDNTNIIHGLSTDDDVKKSVVENGPYDIVYVDGGHDYDVVINDLQLAENIVKLNGFLVLDDAASLLNFKKNHKGFKGHMDVGLAIRDYLDNNVNFKHIFACGHNRVWKRTNE